MTVWAGYYLRDPRGVARDALADSLSRVLSRHPGDVPTVTRLDRVGLVHVETGAFRESSLVVEPGRALTLVAGEPFLDTSGPSSRASDIARLHAAWTQGDFSLTSQTAGTFTGLNYASPTKTLSLIPDKLGVRPIYYAVTDEVIYFACALRILEALESLPKVMDVRGAVETLALGYPLADRTPYTSIHAIRNGEVVAFQDRSIRRTRYWNLADIRARQLTLTEAAEQVHTLFAHAVDRRRADDRRSVAFLSGGLDSRCLVAELVARGVELHTFNFANDGTKDSVFGDAFARVVGTHHVRIPRPPDPVRWSMTMADVWGASARRASLPVERPGLVWSGDGGSVGLGFVGVYPSVIALLRAGKRDEAVRKYVEEHEISVPLRVFRSKVADEVRDLVHAGIREALDEVRGDEDPGREMYAFRMAHDQRRHLVLHFEDVDRHRLEFHLPFYDADLIAAVAAMPPEHVVGHKVYHEALRFFPQSVRAVAWQTYPGHEPCPVPEPADAIDQWGDAQKDLVRRSRRATILGETARVVFSRSFPRPLLNRQYLIAATVAHWLGVGDYSYAIDYAKSFSEMWGASGGRWALTPPNGGVP